MDKMVYRALCQYFRALSKLGYYKYKDVYKLLVLVFFKDFIYSDYRGLISRADYSTIEKALNCLYGTTCLIPYPDYLKMGKLHLGQYTELAQRVSNLEDEVVELKNTDTEEQETK